MGMVGPDDITSFNNPTGTLQLVDIFNLSTSSTQPKVKVFILGKRFCREEHHGRDQGSLLSPEILEALDYFVAPASGNKDDLEHSISIVKHAHPSLKIFLADSSEHPFFSSSQPPSNVEQVIKVSSHQGRIGKELLTSQAGLLVGSSGGKAAFLSAALAGKMKEGETIGLVITNLLLEQ